MLHLSPFPPSGSIFLSIPAHSVAGRVVRTPVLAVANAITIAVTVALVMCAIMATVALVRLPILTTIVLRRVVNNTTGNQRAGSDQKHSKLLHKLS